MGRASTVNSLRSATIFLGLIVVCLGFYSFHQSAWYNRKPIKVGGSGSRSGDGSNNTDPSGRKYLVGDAENPGLYKICTPQVSKKCPFIEGEYLFVSVIITCFVLSVGLMIVSIFVQLNANPFKLIDLLYHIAAAVLLVIAALIYLGDAAKLDDLISKESKFFLSGFGINREEFLITEKYIAAILTLILGIVYAALAYYITKG